MSKGSVLCGIDMDDLALTHCSAILFVALTGWRWICLILATCRWLSGKKIFERVWDGHLHLLED